jgi:hypothetical protein
VEGVSMKEYSTSVKISKVEATNDTLTGRGGLALFNRYLSGVGILDILKNNFGDLRKSMKGLAIWRLFKQVLVFFFDGTSRHLVHFDELKKDLGYAGVIEERDEDLASSHTVKRFFRLFRLSSAIVFRGILLRLFLWRLQIERPDEIELSIDTMVMDNDEAEARQGVEPTYKKVKGFQPLQIIWNGRIVDAIFRGGSMRCNHGKTVIKMVSKIVNYIRANYRADVTIIIRADSGFFDEANFAAFDELGIGFISTGKMYESVKESVQRAPLESWGSYDNGRQAWSYVEFDYGADSWNRSYRAIYTRPVYEDDQMLIEFARPDNVILTNIGVNSRALEHCSSQRKTHWLRATSIIRSHHMRGADELPHRAFKDFGFERLPFKRFAANSAFFYCEAVAKMIFP